jgi:hypothetical protein
MNWSNEIPPVKGVSAYSHIISDTPIGRFKIEWNKKNINGYTVDIDEKYIGIVSSLSVAKEIADRYLLEKYKELTFYFSHESSKVSTESSSSSEGEA